MIDLHLFETAAAVAAFVVAAVGLESLSYWRRNPNP